MICVIFLLLPLVCVVGGEPSTLGLQLSDFDQFLLTYPNANVLSIEPPIIVIDHFVKQKEWKHLLNEKKFLLKLKKGQSY